MKEYIITEERIRHLEAIVDGLRSYRYSLFISEEYYNTVRKEERDKVLDEVISLINKNCFELEGKRLKITPLLLMQKIAELRGEQG